MKKRRFFANENQKCSQEYGYADRCIKVERAFEIALDGMQFDWQNDSNMRETPRRMARMYMNELFKGCYEPEPKFTVFPNTKKYDEMVLLKDVRLVSTCSHHLQPFTGVCHIGYLPSPKGYICGISKLARIVKWFASRPQIQEELTTQIAEYLQDKLKPLGVVVIIEATHGCMTNRGVMEYNSKMVTSKMLGVFKTKPEARAEVMSLIRG